MYSIVILPNCSDSYNSIPNPRILGSKPCRTAAFPSSCRTAATAGRCINGGWLLGHFLGRRVDINERNQEIALTTTNIIIICADADVVVCPHHDHHHEVANADLKMDSPGQSKPSACSFVQNIGAYK